MNKLSTKSCLKACCSDDIRPNGAEPCEIGDLTWRHLFSVALGGHHTARFFVSFTKRDMLYIVLTVFYLIIKIAHRN